MMAMIFQVVADINSFRNIQIFAKSADTLYRLILLRGMARWYRMLIAI